MIRLQEWWKDYRNEWKNVEWINYRFDKSTFEWKNSELTSNYSIFSLFNFIRAIFAKSRVKMNLFCTTKNISNLNEKVYLLHLIKCLLWFMSNEKLLHIMFNVFIQIVKKERYSNLLDFSYNLFSRTMPSDTFIKRGFAHHIL